LPKLSKRAREQGKFFVLHVPIKF
jgi:hypothetical protein